MKRLVLVLCIGGLAAVPASARGGVFTTPFPPDNLFQGHVAGDPNTYFGFDIVGGKHRQKVRHVAVALPMTCYSGDQGMNENRVRATFKLFNVREHFLGITGRRHGHGIPRSLRFLRFFAGEADVDSDLGEGEAYLYGQIRHHGRARGHIRVHTESSAFGKCYSGGLNWRARRGANAHYPPAP